MVSGKYFPAALVFLVAVGIIGGIQWGKHREEVARHAEFMESCIIRVEKSYVCEMMYKFGPMN